MRGIANPRPVGGTLPCAQAGSEPSGALRRGRFPGVLSALAVGLAAVAIGSGGCGRGPEPEAALADRSDDVVRVGDLGISKREFLAERRKVPPTVPDDELLERMTRRLLLFAEARRTGFDRSEEMQEAWRALVSSRFEEAQDAARKGAAEISDADIEACYRQQADHFAPPERRHLALIQVARPANAAPESRAEREREASAVREQAVAGRTVHRDFGELAARHSFHPSSRRSGGDVGWLTRAQAERAWPASVVEAAFALTSPGDISPIVATEEGWYLIKLMEGPDRRPASLDSLRERIRRELARTREAEAQDARFRELRARHGVETHSDRLPVAAPAAPSLAQRPPELSAP